MEPTKSQYHALLRSDLSAFIEYSFHELNPQSTYLPNWHIDAIASALELCRLGITKRLIINEPPRSLKSHCATVVFRAWLMGHNPGTPIICVNYGQVAVTRWNQSRQIPAACRAIQRSMPLKLCATQGAVAYQLSKINKAASWSASSPSAPCATM